MRCKRQARSKSSSRAGSEQLCASPFNCFFFENIAVLVRATYSGERLATQDLRRQIKAPATTFRSTHLDAFQMSQNYLANWIDCICRRKTQNATVELGRPVSRVGHIANLTYRRKRRITLEKTTASQPDYERISNRDCLDSGPAAGPAGPSNLDQEPVENLELEVLLHYARLFFV
jgi:hypothetical protein